jgi:hypothetical protein
VRARSGPSSAGQDEAAESRSGEAAWDEEWASQKTRFVFDSGEANPYILPHLRQAGGYPVSGDFKAYGCQAGEEQHSGRGREGERNRDLH